MRIEPLILDLPKAKSTAPTGDASIFGKMLDDLGSVLGRATGSENAYAIGSGNLQQAVYERAQADVALSVATAAAQRTAQALQSILNMQM